MGIWKKNYIFSFKQDILELFYRVKWRKGEFMKIPFHKCVRYDTIYNIY